MSELKPCPFCGGNNVAISHEADPDCLGRYLTVRCRKCGATSGFKFVSYGNECPQAYQETRTEWNTRAPTPTLTLARDALESGEVIANPDSNEDAWRSLAEKLVPDLDALTPKELRTIVAGRMREALSAINAELKE